ncbi:MAG: GNAT family N-acetyltransferase [Butyrivibrio sp.]|nr:GNAT family N-acetyltransferase [Butyrivibrio sp.]
MNIRKVMDKDLEKVKDLLDQVNLVHHNGRPDIFNIGRKYSDAELLELFKNEERPIFVATDDDDKVMGYAFCISQQHLNDNMLTDIKTLYIDDLCVDEKIRGQHIGRSLYDYVLSYARENGYYNVTLNVWELNQSAKKFYESLGMKVLKTGMETIC